MSRADTADYAALFLRDTPLFDTRAPQEYHKGSFPLAASLPLMTDTERAQVGTCYKQSGQTAAIALGHELVSGEVKRARLQQWLTFAREHPDGYLFCWRGGLRSQIVQQWMREAGVDYPRIAGGYKAMRRFLIDTLERVVGDTPLRILAGRTGCAKTDLLAELPGSIDLEALAHHRGSTFGRRPGGQPSQIDFENRLAIALLRAEAADPRAALVLEDESLLIGRCALPHVLRDKMAVSALVVVERTLEERVEHSFNNYILHKLEEWRGVLGDEQGFTAFAEDLDTSLQRLKKRLGGLRHGQLDALLQQALAAHRQGNSALHRVWIRSLLQDYYDPMYDYQLEKRQARIVFRGAPAAVRDYLRETADP
ncbi:MAG: tRNA 2-selenouridine(34) synthase MnmH [Parahaliea sp.]